MSRTPRQSRRSRLTLGTAAAACQKVGDWMAEPAALNWITLISALIALLALFVIWKTLTATKEAAEAARNSAEVAVSGTRAWIVRTNSEVFGNKPDLPYIVHFTNAGKTPATNIVTTFEFKAMKRSESEPKFSGCPDENRGMVPFVTSGESFSCNLKLPKPVSSTETLYIHGCVRYRDILANDEHITELCETILPGAPGFFAVGIMCQQNNRSE